jgi:hypothetical protein
VFDFGRIPGAEARIKGFRPGVDRIDLRDVTNSNHSLAAWLGAPDDGEGVHVCHILLAGVGEGELSRGNFIV